MSAENNIYLMQNILGKGLEYTNILKLSVDKTDVKYVASKKVPGNMRNQFSADEYKGNFRIATNEDNNWNHLFILDSSLNLISSVRNMSEIDNIQSVYFDGDIGYIVTYMNTDLLYVLDLSDSKSPKIISGLKIPDYSTYLQPLGNGILLDMEYSQYYTDGIKAALFDISDPYNPKEISSLKLGGVSSYTDIGENHKSILNIPKYSLDFFGK